MGWYAETNWELRFLKSDAKALATELLNKEHSATTSQDPLEDIVRCLCEFGEESDFVHEEIDGIIRVSGYTSGKAYDRGPDPDMRKIGDSEYNAGGLGLYRILGKYCTGRVDWNSEEGDVWRIRFESGSWRAIDGEVVFVGDTPPEWERT